MTDFHRFIVRLTIAFALVMLVATQLQRTSDTPDTASKRAAVSLETSYV